MAVTAAVGLLSACAGTPSGSARPPATEAEWRTLATPRPEPLPGAVRVSLAEVQLTGEVEWAAGTQVPPALAVEELVAAGLLRRGDLQFVERRRFAAAAAAERAGVARPRNAPAAGVSPGAELVATATLVSLPGARGSIELRLADARTGAVRATSREPLTEATGPVPLARSIVRGLLAALEDLDRLPPWEDPSATADGISDGDHVSEEALRNFLRGLAAEESWDWEAARVGYQAAARDSGFHEASAALARTARLRLGGTLGES